MTDVKKITYQSLDGTPITETICKNGDTEKRIYESGDLREKIIYKKYNILDEQTNETRILEERIYANKKEIIYKDDDKKLKIKTIYKSKEIIQEINTSLIKYTFARIPSCEAKLRYAENELEKRNDALNN